MVPFLRKTAKAWNVAPEITERSASDMGEIIDFLGRNQLQSGRANISYNGLEFRTEVTYLGAHEAPVQPSRATATPARLDEFTNEEAAAFDGLRDFLKSMSADRKRVMRRHGHLTCGCPTRHHSTSATAHWTKDATTIPPVRTGKEAAGMATTEKLEHRTLGKGGPYGFGDRPRLHVAVRYLRRSQ